MIDSWDDNFNNNRLNLRISRNEKDDDVNENFDLIVIEKFDFFDIIIAKNCEIDVIIENDVDNDDDDVEAIENVETVFDKMIFRR